MYDMHKMAAVSEDIKGKLLSGDSAMRKTAGLAASEYFRTEIRENGIRRQITPAVNVTTENFDTVEDTDFPVMFVEVAPKSAGAYMTSFETGPRGDIIRGRKARVEFNRIMTKKYTIDKIRLTTWKMPILDIFYDLMLKDIMDIEDKVTVDTDDVICGALDTKGKEQGGSVLGGDYVRYETIPAMSRSTVVELNKAMLKSPGQLKPAKFLMNDLTYADFGLLGRQEIGGDLAQDMFINGVSLTKIGGVETIITSKANLVKDGDVYIYTDPKYYGGFYTYEDVSMVTDEKDDIWLSFFAHETVGMSVVNAAGVCKCKIAGSDDSSSSN